ncbi:MAG: hypothetical protein ACOZBZ_04220 [Patescibacteria group bacterium]
MNFYHNLVTEKSWRLLLNLRKRYRFILIGGWAVFLYTKVLKSKDIDLVVEYEELEKLKEEFEISKNDRLKKYEARSGELEIDIYLPFYSNPGIPAEELKKFTVTLSGFTVVEKEILAILKQKVLMARGESIKGRKDLVDLVSLLRLADFDWDKYGSLIKQYKVEEYLSFTQKILRETFEIEEIGLNVHQFARLKRKILPLMEKVK